MGAPRKIMRQYDDLALLPEAMPKNAVRVETLDGPDQRVRHIFYDAFNRRLCSAKAKDWKPEKPKYCGNHMISEVNFRCRMHGGESPRGMKSPSLRTGKYSADLPARLRERMEQVQGDPDLLSLRNELYLVDVRIQDLLANCDEGGSTLIYKEIKEAWHAFRAAGRSKDQLRISEANARLHESIQRGSSESAVWREINDLLDLRRRLLVSEAKVTQTLGGTVPLERVNIMLGFILSMVNQRVSNREEARLLINDILKLTGRGGMGEDVPGTGDQRHLPGSPAATD